VAYIKWFRTILPISVDPRAQANKTSLHPPLENSFDVLPVPPIPPNWRTSTGLAAARPASAAIRIEDWIYMVLEYERLLSVIEKCGIRVEPVERMTEELKERRPGPV
jgi:hypothetical protein